MFQINRQLDKEECRRLIVHCTEEYLTAINENSEFQKYLFHSPFPIENVEIDIYFTLKIVNAFFTRHKCRWN